MMKMAATYKRSDGWYFQADSTTTVGVNVASPPYLALKNDSSNRALGEAVLAALAGSESAIRHPAQDEWGKAFQPMLDLAGAKSWSAFANGAANVSISADDEWITISPWKNAGAKQGFVPIPDFRVRIPAASSPTAIGEALQQVMAIAEQT
jgi:hypothetical protein